MNKFHPHPVPSLELPIVVLGDIHGRSLWKSVVQQHPGCRFVFLGDYCDPQEPMPEEEVLANFEDIIRFKRQHPADVVLLLGNHDLHYLDGIPFRGSRYDGTLAWDIRQLIEGHRDDFQYAWQQDRLLFTHAGVSDLWFRMDFQGDLHSARSVADQLNDPTPRQWVVMCQMGRSRGGDSLRGGIFWADRNETQCDPLSGFRQYVGHSRVKGVQAVEWEADTSITYCDCLKHQSYACLAPDGSLSVASLSLH